MRQSSILLHIRFRLHDLDVAACGVGIRTQLVRRDDKREFIDGMFLGSLPQHLCRDVQWHGLGMRNERQGAKKS